MTIYLHFGMQKAGSSSLQRSLHRKGAWDDFEYLSYGPVQSNALLDFSRAHSLAEFRAEVDEKVGRRIAQSRARNLIISAEAFPLLDRGSFLGLVERLQATGHAVHAVGYIRRPKSFMESIFQQRIKTRRMTDSDLPLLYPSYEKRFSKLDEARSELGASIDYWIFDQDRMVERCVVRDFCHRLGSSFPESDVVIKNVGLSLPAVRLLQIFHSSDRHAEKTTKSSLRNRLLVEALTDLPGGKFRLHSDIVGPILAANAEDIKWMEDRLGCDLSEDIAADDTTAIRELDDLLTPDAEGSDWLHGVAQGGDKRGASVSAGLDREMIVASMLRLHRQLVQSRNGGAKPH